MTRSFADSIARAESLLAEGFSTKQAKKDANEHVGRAFEFAREAFSSVRFAERGDKEWHDMPEAWRALTLDFPYSPAHWSAKRAAKFSAYPEVTKLADACAELRARIAATPVVKKPPTKTAKQREADEKARTCQICGRPIFAELGVIAHHGYQRPGDGWQTASCVGARELPYEADKTILALHVATQKEILRCMVAARADVAAERAPVTIAYEVDRLQEGKPLYYRGRRLTDLVRFEVSRSSFDTTKDEHPKYFSHRHVGRATFDDVLASELHNRDRAIGEQTTYVEWQKGREASWKLLERWDAATGKWEAAQ